MSEFGYALKKGAWMILGVLLEFTPRAAANPERSIKTEILEFLECLDGMDSKDLKQHFLCLLHNGLISAAEYASIATLCQKEKRAF